MLEIIIIVLATLLCGLSLSLRELPVVSGCVQASGAGETTIVKILFPVLTLAAIIFTCFFPGAVETNLESMMSPEMAGGQLIPIGIATATAVVVSKLISRFPAVPLAFTGVLIGAANAAGNAPAWSFSASYLISWIVAPLLCGALAAGIYVLCA